MRLSPTLVAATLVLAGVAPVNALDMPSVQLHGFVSQGYLKSNHNNYLGDTQDSSFAFSEFALNASSQVSDNLRVGMQVFARDLGDLGNNEVTIDWALVDWQWRQEFGIKVGQVKLPFGFLNEYSDLDLAHPTVLLPQTVYDLRLRDFFVAYQGIGAYGTLSGGPVGSLEYHVYGGTRDLATDGSVAAYLTSAYADYGVGLEMTDIQIGMLSGGSLTWNTPLDGLRLNYSAVRIEDMEFSGTLLSSGFAIGTTTGTLKFVDRNIFGFEYTIERMRFVGEYSHMDIDFENALYFGGPTVTNRDLVTWAGWYGQVAYRLLDQLEIAGTYGEFYGDRSDPKGDDYGDRYNAFTHDLALSLRYDISDAWIVKIEGHHILGRALLFSQDNPDGAYKDMIMLALKTTVSF